MCATSAKGRGGPNVGNCLIDEGGPLGTGWQERVPNHLRRLWSKATVVSTEGKGLGGTRSGDWQEEDRKETTEDVSKPYGRCQNRRDTLLRDQFRRRPAYGRSGIRHKGGLSLPEARKRNVGTWGSDDNGEATSGRTTRARVRKRRPGAEQPVVAEKCRKRDGAKGLCYGAKFNEPTSNGRSR